MQYTEKEIKKGIKLHEIKTEKFKTNLIAVFLSMPITREDVTKNLAKNEGNVGFIFDAMAKEELFKTVILDGALPRKTFSMGHSYDKRFYLEARKIK